MGTEDLAAPVEPRTGDANSSAFEVNRFAEFVFEPFAASLVYLPESVIPNPRITEYFLGSEREATAEEAAIVDAPLVWSREPDSGQLNAETKASSARRQRRRKALKDDEAVDEEPRFYTPKPIRFFDPVATEETQDATSADENTEKKHQSIHLSPELKAAILAIDEELRRKREQQNEDRSGDIPTDEKKPRKEELTSLNLSQITATSSVPDETPMPEPAVGAEPPPDFQPIDLGTEPDFTGQAEDDLPVTAHILPVEEKPDLASLVLTSRADISNLPVEDADTNEIPEPETPAVDQAASEQPSLSLVRRFEQWIDGLASRKRNQRSGERFTIPDLVAFYWSGGNSKPHEVVNISANGFYLRTTEPWLPDTLVRMVLQKPSSSDLE